MKDYHGLKQVSVWPTYLVFLWLNGSKPLQPGSFQKTGSCLTKTWMHMVLSLDRNIGFK